MMVDFIQRQAQMVPARWSEDDGEISMIVPYGTIRLPSDACARLDEWARWVRVKVGIDPHGRCASAEGRYDSRYPDGDGAGSCVNVDMQSVLAVERVVCTRLPDMARIIVQRHFVMRSPPFVITRALGIHNTSYGRELRRAVMMVKNNLTRAGIRD